MRGRWVKVIARVGVAGVVTTLAVGCVTVGHRAIEGSRTDYNVALTRTDDEQLLLNLVRLRYRDRPLFLEATALNTQFSFAGSADAAAGFGGGSGVATEYGVGGGIAFEEKPTVTYVPLQGPDYVQRLLSSVSIETLVLLDASGWSTERVFRLCLQGLNDLDNAPRAAGPTPAEAPDYDRFLRATRLIRALELTGGVSGTRRGLGDDAGLWLEFSDEARSRPQFAEWVELLGLDPEAQRFRITPGVGGGAGDEIRLRPRSLAGVFYFLSQSVEVPDADVEAGRVTVTLDAAGEPFDWGRVTDGLMRIRSSKSRPDHASVAVRYRGHWFYIDDSDLDSKSTFLLLGQLYALQSGGGGGTTPVLTLPVGG